MIYIYFLGYIFLVVFIILKIIVLKLVKYFGIYSLFSLKDVLLVVFFEFYFIFIFMYVIIIFKDFLILKS